MIISASRRTDIPAFFPNWFMDKIRRSYCYVPNPFNPKQVKKVSLKVEDVDLFVFWTKNPEPFFPYLDELDGRGFKYYFLFTLTPYEKPLEPFLFGLKDRVRVFKELAKKISPEKVIWRYDPIIFTPEMSYDYHLERFSQLASLLKGATQRVIFSFYSPYPGSEKRLKGEGIEPAIGEKFAGERIGFLGEMHEIGEKNGMILTGCATPEIEETPAKQGKCIDERFINEIFKLELCGKKDTGQRSNCRCIPSQDIGVYDTCLHGCLYCYARGTRNRVKSNLSKHRTQSSCLVG